MSILAVLVDFGGVLLQMVDNRPRQELAEQLGVPVSRLGDLVFFSETARRASLGEIPVRMHWETVRDALGITPQGMADFLDKYWSADEVNWQLLAYLSQLKPRYKLGLLSNAWDDLRQTMHERWNIDGLFDALIISAEVKMAKPDPRIYHLAADNLQVQSNQVLFIDDVAINVEAARKEGMKAIQYFDSGQTIDELQHFLSSG